MCFRYIEFASDVSLSKRLESVRLKASANLVFQDKIEVSLVCRYPHTVSVSSAGNDVLLITKIITKINIDLMTNLKIDDALLDSTSSGFKDVAGQIEDTMYYYWKQFSTDSPPFYIVLEVFMTQDTYAEYAVF